MGKTKNKLNRYGKMVGVSAICGQIFRERPKKHRLSAEMSKLMERNGQNGKRTDESK